MENVVAARRLRKSMLSGTKNIELYDLNKGYNKSFVEKEELKKINIGIKNKIIIKFCICSLLLFVIITCKMFFKEKIMTMPKIMRVCHHYQTDFSKEVVLDKFEYQVNKLVITTGNIIPEKIRDFVKYNYLFKVKPYFLSFKLKETTKSLFKFSNKKNIVNDKEVKVVAKLDEELNGIGGAEPLENIENKSIKINELKNENKLEEVVSAISIMDNDIQTILSKNINIIAPINGVITSKYGVRDEVFKEVDPYHTGTDIAAKKGTPILSATNGKVTKIKLNNKYYGNYVEVTQDEVIFKYAHMEKINVKLNDIIKQKEIIGTVGSTGMSTGSHLHFEVKIDGRTVNPQDLVKL
ncbi:MAG: M23 family metallopeptidase [Clostridia bacterium]